MVAVRSDCVAGVYFVPSGSMTKNKRFGVYMTFEQALIVHDLISRCIERLHDDALDDLARREYMDVKEVLRTQINRYLENK